MRRFLIAPLLLAIVPVLATAAPSPSVTKTFSGWTATCDNLRDCAVIGSTDEGDGLFYVRIARAAAMSSEPSVKVVLAGSDPIPHPPSTIVLTAVRGATSAALSPLAVKTSDDDGSVLAGTLAGAPAFAFVSAIRDADALDYGAGPSRGRLALKGLAAALRFIDDRQGRAGTPTALIARGMTPSGQVPAPVPPPVVAAAPLTATSVDKPPISPALIAMAKPACDPEVVEAHEDASAWMLGPDRMLVAVPCSGGVYNVTAALFTTDAKGEQPRPAMLEQPSGEGDASADNVVANVSFDVKSLELTGLDKGRGLGDCGSMRTWVWTGEIFALLRASALEACPGALAEDWPSVYAAKRK